MMIPSIFFIASRRLVTLFTCSCISLSPSFFSNTDWCFFTRKGNFSCCLLPTYFLPVKYQSAYLLILLTHTAIKYRAGWYWLRGVWGFTSVCFYFAALQMQRRRCIITALTLI